MRHLLTALALAGALVAGAVLAGDDKPQVDPAAAFRLGDANKDGKLSRDEFLKLVANAPKLKGNRDLANKIFDLLDTNRDGFLSLEEFKKIHDLDKQGGAESPRPEKPATPAPRGGFNDQPTPEQLAFFEKKIRPVLVDQCYKCHSAQADKIKGGLTLDTREGLRKGGDSGPGVVAGDPGKSLLIKALRHQDENLKMPPREKLPAAVVADFEQWVKMGAPDPRGGAPAAAHKEIDVAQGRQFWAFRPPQKGTPPTVKDAAWPRADLDRFLLAALEAKGLKPVADAEPRALLRRLSFDLIGLPPTPEEVEAFVRAWGAKPQAALEAAVDRLLASPQFGERWGRHWLDVARYAESSGKQVNFNYPHAWRYRDYVIAAFNADKPFDRFVTEQVAGDLLTARDEKERAEHAIATGFLALGPKSLNERNRLQFEMDVADEQIDVTTQAFLGVTAACARCHDHKFDPIPQKDYYALAGIFRSTETCYGTIRLIQANHPAPLLPLSPRGGQPAGMEPLSRAERQQLEQQIDRFKKELADLGKGDVMKTFLTMGGIRTRIQLGMAEAKLGLYEADGTPKLLAMGVREKPRAADSPVYTRGEVEHPAEVVPRGVLQVVCAKQPKVSHGSGRLELAHWLAGRDNPLTARVLVNRVWLHLFGRGLVATPDNFGAAGQPPSHPELLDHLAVTFMDDGWSVKKLIRRIVLSRAYGLSTKCDAKNYEADPDNELVWRMSPRRLDAEALRDAMLALAGQLDLTPPKGSPVAKAGDGYSQATYRTGGYGEGRNRSVYLPIVRDALPEALALFDAADPSLIVAERATTTVPAQGLYLLNNPFVLRLADAAADQLLAGSGTTRDRLNAAYRRFYGRPATDAEAQAAEAFLARYAAAAGKGRGPREAWGAFCQALFASAEFLYLD